MLISRNRVFLNFESQNPDKFRKISVFSNYLKIRIRKINGIINFSEIISNTGHNIAADYWSLGILVFELLSKRTPFRAKDDLAIYEGILRGIHRCDTSF